MGAEVFYCETGEANVVSTMMNLSDEGYEVALGVEGGNGGTIFGSAPCRDGVLTAISLAVASLYQEVRERISQAMPSVAQLPGIEGAVQLLPKWHTRNFKKETSDIPPMSVLGKRVEEIFAERLWPSLYGRFVRYEFQYFSTDKCIINNTGIPGKSMPEGDFGWRVALFDKDGNASFGWMRLSQTVASTMRFVTDSKDERDARLLENVMNTLFDSAVTHKEPLISDKAKAGIAIAAGIFGILLLIGNSYGWGNLFARYVEIMG